MNDFCDKSEDEEKTISNEDEVTLTSKMILDTWSAIKNDNTDKIDTVMKLMITNDQKNSIWRRLL